MNEKKETFLPPHKEVPCRPNPSEFEKTTSGRTPQYFDAFPRDCKFAFMTPGYYATGFRILDVYKTSIDFTEMRNLFFLEDPKKENKWGSLRKRVPYPETRVIDLPGTRDLNYHNYCLRSLTPESAMSWRRSIQKEDPYHENENESKPECVCEES